jgi:hypothetical protein
MINRSTAPADCSGRGQKGVSRKDRDFFTQVLAEFAATLFPPPSGRGAGRIWSEDLNSGQRYFDIVVENPSR